MARGGVVALCAAVALCVAHGRVVDIAGAPSVGAAVPEDLQGLGVWAGSELQGAGVFFASLPERFQDMTAIDALTGLQPNPIKFVEGSMVVAWPQFAEGVCLWIEEMPRPPTWATGGREHPTQPRVAAHGPIILCDEAWAPNGLLILDERYANHTLDAWRDLPLAPPLPPIIHGVHGSKSSNNTGAFLSLQLLRDHRARRLLEAPTHMVRAHAMGDAASAVESVVDLLVGVPCGVRVPHNESEARIGFFFVQCPSPGECVRGNLDKMSIMDPTWVDPVPPLPAQCQAIDLLRPELTRALTPAVRAALEVERELGAGSSGARAAVAAVVEVAAGLLADTLQAHARTQSASQLSREVMASAASGSALAQCAADAVRTAAPMHVPPLHGRGLDALAYWLAPMAPGGGVHEHVSGPCSPPDMLARLDALRHRVFPDGGCATQQPLAWPRAPTVAEPGSVELPGVPYSRADLALWLSPEWECGLIGVEVGSHAGLFARRLADTWHGMWALFMLDPWEEKDVSHVSRAYQQEDALGAAGVEGFRMVRAKATFQAAAAGPRVRGWRGYSTAAAQEIAARNLTIDWAYIDARHDYQSAGEDTAAFWEAVRPGGMLMGHDFVDGAEARKRGGGDWAVLPDGSRHPEDKAVRGAIEDFARARGLGIACAGCGEEAFPSWVMPRV